MVSKERKLNAYLRILEKNCKGVKFNDLCQLLEMHGWYLQRIARNAHYVYKHPVHTQVVMIAKPHPGNQVKRIYCNLVTDLLKKVEGYDENDR